MKILIHANKIDEMTLENCDNDSCYSDCSSYHPSVGNNYPNANESYGDNNYDDSDNSATHECSDGD